MSLDLIKYTLAALLTVALLSVSVVASVSPADAAIVAPHENVLLP